MPQQEILDSKKYFQDFFPQVFNQSPFAQMEDLSVCLVFCLSGPGGGEWTLSFVRGQLIEVLPKKTSRAGICYSLNTTTFFQIASGQLNPQQAFFQGKVKLEGDTLTALKMATILTEFFSAYPFECAKEPTLEPQVIDPVRRSDPNLHGSAGSPDPAKDRNFIGNEDQDLPIVEERVYFESGDEDGKIEGVLAYREEARATTGVLIVPPHPYLGGNMDNNIVLCLAQSLALEGYVTLRFNYRGVGANQATLPVKQEELEAFWKESLSPGDNQKLVDVLAAITFLTGLVSQVQPSTLMSGGDKDKRVVLIGYSFGAYLAALATQDSPLVEALIMVAPPVAFHRFDSIKDANIPKLIIGSDNDFAYPPEVLQEFFDALKGTKKMCLLSGKDHFFIGQEKEIASLTHNFLAEYKPW